MVRSCPIRNVPYMQISSYQQPTVGVVSVLGSELLKENLNALDITLQMLGIPVDKLFKYIACVL